MLHDVLRRLAAEVAATARRERLSGSVVTLKIRFADFETHIRQRKLSGSTQDERVMLREAWRLFLRGKLPQKPVRLIANNVVRPLSLAVPYYSRPLLLGTVSH